jgi:phosphoadenosine phosphosulfate reductase
MIKYNNYDFQKFSEQFSKLGTVDLLKVMIKKIFKRKIVVTSSFGAESVVILDLVSKIDKNIPIIFLDTGKLFPETLDYLIKVKKFLSLKNIKIQKPSLKDLRINDSKGILYKTDPELCCKIRKVIPLEKAINPYEAWINGRKRFHGLDRKNIKKIEKLNNIIKINPLTDWSFEEINNYIKKNKLPEHPLIKKGYKSIGCLPCTNKIADDKPTRSGRWKDLKKNECGIHVYNPSI